MDKAIEDVSSDIEKVSPETESLRENKDEINDIVRRYSDRVKDRIKSIKREPKDIISKFSVISYGIFQILDNIVEKYQIKNIIVVVIIVMMMVIGYMSSKFIFIFFTYPFCILVIVLVLFIDIEEYKTKKLIKKISIKELSLYLFNLQVLTILSVAGLAWELQ